MHWLANKPAVAAFLPFAAGLVVSFFSDLPVMPFGLVLIILVVFARLLHSREKLAEATILLSLFLVGLLRLELKTAVHPANHIRKFCDLPYVISLEGIICRPVEIHKDMQQTILQVDSVWVLSQVYAAQGLCLLQLYEPRHGLKYGDRLVVRGQLRSPPGERNPGEFNYQKYLAAQDLFAILHLNAANNVVVIHEGEGNPILTHLLYPVRRFIMSVIDASLSGQPAALLKALLLGARGELDENIQQHFINVGVIHVLAVSGLHVGFVLAGLLGFLSFLRLPTLWRIVLASICLIFYAFLTGLKPSIVRATIMALIYLFGLLLQRRTHVLNTMAIAAFVILCISPLSLFEAGFQLSFVAVLGIVLIYDRFDKLLRPWLNSIRERGRVVLIWMIKLFAVSLAAQIATLPLTVYYFSRFSLIAFFANLFVIPVVAIIVALGMPAILLSTISLAIGGIYLNVVWLLLSGLIAFVEVAEKLPLAYLTMPRPSLLVLSFYFMGVMLFVAWPHVKARKTLIYLMIFLLNGYIWLSQKDEQGLKVTFFDVGLGDAALFEFPGGKTMLVDAGDCTQYCDYGERIIDPYLVRNGITKIDHLILTHAHSDHIGGAVYLMENKRIGRIVKTHLQVSSEMDCRIEELATRKNIPIRYVQAGDTLLVESDVLVLILHPTSSFVHNARQNSSELNNSSLVFKCVYYATTIFMAGDAERPAESSMLTFGSVLQSTILKVAHHGSRTASSESFRRAIAADYGIVSVGKWNRFGLPSHELLCMYEKEGTKILQTLENGAVQFILYPDHYARLR